MNRLWTRWTAVLLAALVLSTGARAQNDCFLEVDDVCVELPNGLPTPGREFRIDVTVSETVLGEGRLFYRPTGSGPGPDSYASVEPDLEGNRYIVRIPAEALTIRGLDVYGTYVTAEDEDEQYPAVDPVGNPLHIPTYIGSFTSPVELPARTYRMISTPVDVGLGSVLDVLADDLGTPNIAQWRLLRWNPSAQRYDELPDGINSFADGAAFWIITADGATFDVDLVESTNPDSAPVIALAPGMNQVGNPYAFPVAWDAVRQERNVGPLLEYDSEIGDYREVTTLEPWAGYFVENLEEQPIALSVTDQESRGGAVQGPETLYAVHIGARAGEYADLNNVVGLAEAATAGHDRLDVGEPPPVGEHLRLSVVDGEQRAMRSLKPPSAEGVTWDFEVSATSGLLDGGPLRVSLDVRETGTRPAGFGLFVIDLDRGTAVELADGLLDVTLRAGQPVRHFRLIVGTDAFAQSESDGAPLTPAAFGLAPGYPNPFAAQTTIPYQLDARGTATLEVFDLLGRRIRVLAGGEHSAGTHTAQWDGHDAAGRPVANGVYLVRLRTAAVSATRRISVLR